MLPTGSKYRKDLSEMATKKTNTTGTKTPVAEAVKTEAVKAAAEVKADAVKAVKTVEKVAEKAVEKVAEKTVEKVAEKAPAKKPATKRASAKKVAEPKMEVHFQFAGKDVLAKSVLDKAVEAYKNTHKDAEIKEVELYIVAEEGAAYYVVNGEASDDFKVIL